MEQIDIITVAFIFLGLLAIVLGVVFFIAFVKSDETPTLADDLPAHYEDYELSERPYIEML